MAMIIFCPLKAAVTQVEFGLIDESESANSDGFASPGERVSLLFSIQEENKKFDSVVAVQGNFYVIHCSRFDPSRQRGNIELTFRQNLAPDTVIHVLMSAYKGETSESLLFKIPVVFRIDSLKTEVSEKNATVRIFHNPFVNQRFGRIVRIRRFPDMWDTSISSSFFDSNSMIVRFGNIGPGFYSAEVLVNNFGNALPVKSPLDFFYVSDHADYEYVFLTDVDERPSGLRIATELSNLVNESKELKNPDDGLGLHKTAIIPISYITEETCRDLCENASIVFVRTGENFVVSDDLAKYISEIYREKPVVLLGFSALKALYSSNFTKYSGFTLNPSEVMEYDNICGTLYGELPLDFYFSVNNFSTCPFEDTLLRISSIPILARSGNLMVLFPQNFSGSNRYSVIVDELIEFIRSDAQTVTNSTDSLPVRIMSVFPSSLGATGAKFFIEALVPGNIRITINDITGREMATVFEGRLEEGQHCFSWDGRDRNGMALPISLYFVNGVFNSGEATIQVTQKITLF
ncbi:hypothetical protein JXA84_07035 [candidate division WOR-3 bacterium]|nr:hypothetical protein [candidate division WOR-3 bacterium]